MVAQNIGFAIIAIIMVVGALRVVTTSNVVHAALWLVVVLAGVAAQYILLAAEFVAVTQVLVYIGAVMVLFLFGTMLTRSRIGVNSGLNNRYSNLGIPVAMVLFAAMSLALAIRLVPRKCQVMDRSLLLNKFQIRFLGRTCFRSGRSHLCCSQP
jgi:NADH:ubiquinone oxidoreductase subunit 6 (subunit J)